ncbi:MAG: PAS domain S-box protein [Chitinophagaceae bacterium]|nr:MAG: PAS domain S-box protein [Chitinophagaceae bacterium]
MMQVDPEHLTSLFENATEGIVLTNGNGNVVMINPAIQRMFGYAPAEIIGKPVETLVPVHVSPVHAELRQQFYKSPQNRVMGHSRDLHGKRKDGSELPVEVSLSFYHRNQELFVIAFVVDITIRKIAEKDLLAKQKELEAMTEAMQVLNNELENKVKERTTILEEALQKLEESQTDLNEALKKEKQLNEVKSSFVSLASHEFRTPLSTIASSAAIIGRYPEKEDQEKRERHIIRIKESVNHLNDILEDFLSLGKLEDGKISANPAKFNLSALLIEVTDDFIANEKISHQIKLISESVSDFFTDKKIVRNILINILGNAIKFSAPGSLVIIHATQKEHEFTIKIIDQGIGISEQDQTQLFTSFFRGRNAANVQGTGLGLNIVRRYLELLRGRILVSSQLGIGTRIEFTIPEFHMESP